jgi:hypothetical protein
LRTCAKVMNLRITCFTGSGTHCCAGRVCSPELSCRARRAHSRSPLPRAACQLIPSGAAELHPPGGGWSWARIRTYQHRGRLCASRSGSSPIKANVPAKHSS